MQLYNIFHSLHMNAHSSICQAEFLFPVSKPMMKIIYVGYFFPTTESSFPSHRRCPTAFTGWVVLVMRSILILMCNIECPVNNPCVSPSCWELSPHLGWWELISHVLSHRTLTSFEAEQSDDVPVTIHSSYQKKKNYLPLRKQHHSCFILTILWYFEGPWSLK